MIPSQAGSDNKTILMYNTSSGGDQYAQDNISDIKNVSLNIDVGQYFGDMTAQVLDSRNDISNQVIENVGITGTA